MGEAGGTLWCVGRLAEGARTSAQGEESARKTAKELEVQGFGDGV